MVRLAEGGLASATSTASWLKVTSFCARSSTTADPRLPADAHAARAAVDLRYLACRLGFAGRTRPRIGRALRPASAACARFFVRHLAGAASEPTIRRSAAHPEGSRRRRRHDAASPPRHTRRESRNGSDARLRAAPYGAPVAVLFASVRPNEIERHVGRWPPRLTIAASRRRRNGPERRAEGLTVVAYDYLGELSMICGLIFAYGFIIGQVTSTHHQPGDLASVQRKIVDVFIVRTVDAPATATMWHATERTPTCLHFSALEDTGSVPLKASWPNAWPLAQREPEGACRAAHGIDRQTSRPKYTVLQISAPDTWASCTSSPMRLALGRADITQVGRSSAGTACAIPYVTDSRGEKIKTEAQRQRELRAATVLVKHFTDLFPLVADPGTGGRSISTSIWASCSAAFLAGQLVVARAARSRSMHWRSRGRRPTPWDDFLRMQYEQPCPVVLNATRSARPKTRTRFTSCARGVAGPRTSSPPTRTE